MLIRLTKKFQILQLVFKDRQTFCYFYIRVIIYTVNKSAGWYSLFSVQFKKKKSYEMIGKSLFRTFFSNFENLITYCCSQGCMKILSGLYQMIYRIWIIFHTHLFHLHKFDSNIDRHYRFLYVKKGFTD